MNSIKFLLFTCNFGEVNQVLASEAYMNMYDFSHPSCFSVCISSCLTRSLPDSDAGDLTERSHL